MERVTTDMRIWLFDLAHGNLKSDKAVLSGFIRYYVLYGLTLDNVKDDIHFRTNYGVDGVIKAYETLIRVLRDVSCLGVLA